MDNVQLITEEKKPQGSERELHKILLVADGEGRIIAGEKSYGLFSGLILVIPKGIDYELMSDGSYRLLSVSGDFNRLHFLDEVYCTVDNVYSEGRSLAEAIIRSNRSKADYSTSLVEAYVKYISQSITSAESFNYIIHRITTEIERNYSSCEFDLNAVIASVGYTEDYVRQKFLNITGMTPTRYLTSVRMQNAKTMLKIFSRTTDIQEIALKCGYYDAAYFSRVFKKTFGISPKAYREG